MSETLKIDANLTNASTVAQARQVCGVCDWIPFFQGSLWPTFWIFVLLLLRKHILKLLNEITKRIERGDEIDFGKWGKIGAPQLSPASSEEVTK